MNDSLWREAERNQCRRERTRLIRNGTIVPFNRGLPTVMIQDSDGKWWPNRNFVESVS